MDATPYLERPQIVAASDTDLSLEKISNKKNRTEKLTNDSLNSLLRTAAYLFLTINPIVKARRIRYGESGTFRGTFPKSGRQLTMGIV